MDWKLYTHAFNEEFSSFLKEKTTFIEKNYGPTTSEILDYIHQYQQGGKRFRPYMVYLRHRLCGGTLGDDEIIRLGMICECIHLMALVHDDICDQGFSRHHVDTYHIHLSKTLGNDHHGLSQSLLVGDLFYTRAMQLLLSVKSVDAQKLITDMLEKVIVGEMQDVLYSHIEENIGLEDILLKDHLKSGQYTFQTPMLFGATLAGITQEQFSLIKDIGHHVGLGFQLRDDLLDRLPDDDGKTKLSDLAEGNQTVVWSILRDTLSDEDRTFLCSQRGKSLEDLDKEKIRDVWNAYPITQKAREQIIAHLDEGEKLLLSFPGDESSLNAMKEIISFLKYS